MGAGFSTTGKAATKEEIAILARNINIIRPNVASIYANDPNAFLNIAIAKTYGDGAPKIHTGYLLNYVHVLNQAYSNALIEKEESRLWLNFLNGVDIDKKIKNNDIQTFLSIKTDFINEFNSIRYEKPTTAFENPYQNTAIKFYTNFILLNDKEYMDRLNGAHANSFGSKRVIKANTKLAKCPGQFDPRREKAHITKMLVHGKGLGENCGVFQTSTFQFSENDCPVGYKNSDFSSHDTKLDCKPGGPAGWFGNVGNWIQPNCYKSDYAMDEQSLMDCCMGKKNQKDCHPDYCGGEGDNAISGKCRTMLKNKCGKPENFGLDECKRFFLAMPTDEYDLKFIACKGDLLTDSSDPPIKGSRECRSWAKDNPGSLDNRMMYHCNSQKGKDDELCACYVDTQADKSVSKMKSIDGKPYPFQCMNLACTTKGYVPANINLISKRDYKCNSIQCNTYIGADGGSTIKDTSVVQKCEIINSSDKNTKELSDKLREYIRDPIVGTNMLRGVTKGERLVIERRIIELKTKKDKYNDLKITANDNYNDAERKANLSGMNDADKKKLKDNAKESYAIMKKAESKFSESWKVLRREEVKLLPCIEYEKWDVNTLNSEIDDLDKDITYGLRCAKIEAAVDAADSSSRDSTSSKTAKENEITRRKIIASKEAKAAADKKIKDEAEAIKRKTLYITLGLIAFFAIIIIIIWMTKPVPKSSTYSQYQPLVQIPVLPVGAAASSY
jgi:hypothetical protein